MADIMILTKNKQQREEESKYNQIDEVVRLILPNNNGKTLAKYNFPVQRPQKLRHAFFGTIENVFDHFANDINSQISFNKLIKKFSSPYAPELFAEDQKYHFFKHC